MNFYSPLFLFLFLPLVLACYWLVGNKWRVSFLLLASLSYYAGYNIFFSAWQEGKGGSGFLFLLLYYIAANYFLGIMAAAYRGSTRGRYVILLSLAANLAPLVWYKYAGFIAGLMFPMLHLSGNSPSPQLPSHYIPLGISFFSFQAIAYVLDVYHEKIEPERSPARFALFLAIFPKIIAGPIIRYQEVAADLAGPIFSADLFASGVRRFVIGLGKKLLLADMLAKTADQVFSVPGTELTASIAWLGLLTYTLQLYLDFSGYTDMAIGLGRMFGFKFQENFNYPYIARSLTEFWRRWHISLSTWLRDYLFLPLSHALMTDRIRLKIAHGRYSTNYRTLFSIVVVFTVCGLWHGAGWNFIVWGLLHGSVLALESLWLSKVIKKWWAPLQHMYLVLVVMLAWVFFRLPTLGGAIDYLGALAGRSASPDFHYDLRMYIDNAELLALIAGIVACTPIVRTISERLNKRGHTTIGALCEISGMIVVLFLSLCTLASSTFTPFLYQKF